jgi:hypothetical protein
MLQCSFLQGRKGGEPIKEKNWMPFVYKEHLYMVHSVVPHRVFRMSANGTAVQQYLTESPSWFAPFNKEDVHGGPPVVYIPSERSATKEPYFLGIFHFFQVRGPCLQL